MKTKEYLGQIDKLKRKIKNSTYELKEFEELSCSVSGISYDEKVQTSLSPDKIGNAIVKIEKMRNELIIMIDEYLILKNEIICQIESLENNDYYSILFSRYVEDKKFEQISTEMGFSFRHITRLHGKALIEFEKKYGEKYLQKMS